MGFSVFSIIEMLYFLSLRPYCHYLKNAAKQRETMQRVAQRFGHFRVKDTKNPASVKNGTVNDMVFPHVN